MTKSPYRSFFVLWTGQALSLIGSQAVQFAIIWWLTLKTESAAILAAATFVGLLPQVALGPFIGALVDRWNRKRTMLLADSTVALASAVLAVMFWTGNASVPHVFVLLLVRALGAAFHAPAMLASTTLMVPEEHLARIQGMNQGLQGGLLIISAPLGALLYAGLSMAGVMVVDVVTAAFAVLPLLWIHVPQPSSDLAAAQTSNAPHSAHRLLAEVRAGISYLWQLEGHFSLLLIAALINLFLVPAFSLLPLLVSERGGTALELGWINVGFGVGSLVGGIALGVWGGFRRRIVTSLCALIGLGLSTALLGASAAAFISISVAAIFAVGAMAALTNGPIQAIVQATILPEFQGRVFTLYSSLAGLTAPLGLAVAAPVADWLGVEAWYLVGGAVCTAMGIAGFLIPGLMRIEQSSIAAQGMSAEAL